MAVKEQDPYLKRSSVNYRDPAAVVKEAVEEPVVEEAKPAKAKKAVKEPVVEE